MSNNPDSSHQFEVLTPMSQSTTTATHKSVPFVSPVHDLIKHRRVSLLVQFRRTFLVIDSLFTGLMTSGWNLVGRMLGSTLRGIGNKHPKLLSLNCMKGKKRKDLVRRVTSNILNDIVLESKRFR